MQGKAEDTGGLSPVKDDNAAMRTLYLRTFARNSDDCYKFAARHSFFVEIRARVWKIPEKGRIIKSYA